MATRDTVAGTERLISGTPAGDIVMLLRNKNAIIYRAGGSLGSAVARALAKAGANVLVTGRTLGPVETPANEIAAAGGKAKAVTVDALDARRLGSTRGSDCGATSHIRHERGFAGGRSCHGGGRDHCARGGRKTNRLTTRCYDSRLEHHLA
jgi:hypothetical protein